MKKRREKTSVTKKIFYQILQVLMQNPILQNIRILFYFFDKIVLLFIKSPKKRDTDKKNVLVVFPFALGDCVMFLGTISNLRRVYPADEYNVSLACQTEYRELFKEFFDEIVAIDYNKASANPFYRIQMCRQLRKNYYDIVFDPIGCEECSPNVFSVNATCATEKIGVLSPSEKKIQCPKWIQNRVYDRVIQIEQKNLHRIQYYACVWEKLGNIKCTAHPATFRRIKLKWELPENYFIVFPSASLPVKQWPLERFAEITRKIYAKTGYVLVVCGTEHDAVSMERFLAEIPEIPKYNLLGKTNVQELIEVVGRTRLLVTNDTSIYHIGVAQKRKVCVVTGRYVFDMFINYKYAEQGYPDPAIVCHEGECCNCNNHCIYKVKEVYPCVNENTVDDVWKAVEKLLEMDA